MLLVLLPFILIYTPRPGQGFALIIWDIQTGAIVGELRIKYGGRLMFHGDQRTITIVAQGQYLNTFNALNGMQLCQELALPQGTWLGTHWPHKDSLQLVTGVKTNGKLVIDIWRLQPTSTPHLVCSLHFLYYLMKGDSPSPQLPFVDAFSLRRDLSYLMFRTQNPY